MGTSPDIEALIGKNKSYAQSHQPLPLFSELPALNLPPPSTVILSCADPRVWPEKFLELAPGEAVVFRVIGGRISQEIIRQILILDAFLGHGQLRNLIIVHHTDCGASHFTSAGVKQAITSQHPESLTEIAAWQTGAFDELSVAESVVADIRSVKNDAMLSEVLKANTAGFVFDVKTGLLGQVSA